MQPKRPKKYGLVWEEKTEDVVEQCKNELPVLEEVVSKEITKDKNLPVNLLIEGDNYHALSVLNYTHAGKIDVIYIDPPYNTGNKSWKYNNHYVEKDDTYKHSNWLSFMKKRVELCLALLKEDGVIVVTIDDHEFAGLTLLLDKVFGENNRLGTIAIMHNPRGRSDDKYLATSHEYAIFYGRNPQLTKTSKLKLTEEQAEDFPFEDEISRYRLLPLKRTGSNSTPNERPNLYYPVYCDPSAKKMALTKPKLSGWKEILPLDTNGAKRVWRWGKTTLAERFETEIIIKVDNGTYNVLAKDRIKEGRKPKTVWVNPKYDASSHGTMLLQKILGKRKSFDYPKSIYAVLDTLQILANDKKKGLILDFFAGSGTTGHAVMLLNKSDDGKRHFILCTNNENKIAEEVCYPRIKKSIEGVSGLEEITGIPANLRYFKTAFVSKSKVSDDTRRELVKRSSEMICVRENTFDRVVDKSNFKIFKDSDHTTGILFDLDSLDAFKNKLREQKLPAHIYVFSLTNDTFNEDFEDLGLEHKLCPIPESILEVYRKLFR